MSPHQLLAQLHGLHQMMVGLVASVSESEAYRCFHAELAPLAWYLGRGTYLETYWLREVVQDEPDLTARVREIFAADTMPGEEQWQRLPPRDHLLNWALELQEENITRLANPRLLPPHPLVAEARLLPLITQQQGWIYEQMLMSLTQRQLRQESSHHVRHRLQGERPTSIPASVTQGHYRIGAKNDPGARDNELPPQIVELSSFRIDRHPASNANYLAFIEADGYENHDFWDEAGWAWCRNTSSHPEHWRRDPSGNWYAVGLNGPHDLIDDQPVTGISRHEARAYARWVSSLGGEHAGAVPQHEFQWEVAARTRAIDGIGHVWEWCSNRFLTYDGYQAPVWSEGRSRELNDDRYFVLRGASIHTQPSLRRTTFRNCARPECRYQFSGVRLVFPPE